VAALDDLLALVAAEDPVRAEAPIGEVGGERVDAVVQPGLDDRLLVAFPGDRRTALASRGLDLDQALDLAGEDPRHASVDLLAALVVAPPEAVLYPQQLRLGPLERPLAGGADLALLLGGMDV